MSSTVIGKPAKPRSHRVRVVVFTDPNQVQEGVADVEVVLQDPQGNSLGVHRLYFSKSPGDKKIYIASAFTTALGVKNKTELEVFDAPTVRL